MKIAGSYAINITASPTTELEIPAGVTQAIATDWVAPVTGVYLISFPSKITSTGISGMDSFTLQNQNGTLLGYGTANNSGTFLPIGSVVNNTFLCNLNAGDSLFIKAGTASIKVGATLSNISYIAF